MIREASERMGQPCRIAASLITAMLFTGCSLGSPIDIRACHVEEVDNNSEFSVDVFNTRQSATRKIQIIVGTAGLHSDLPKKDGQADYVIYRAIPPGKWVHEIVDAEPDSSASTLRQRLGRINACYVQSVDFEDATSWDHGSPL